MIILTLNNQYVVVNQIQQGSDSTYGEYFSSQAQLIIRIYTKEDTVFEKIEKLKLKREMYKELQMKHLRSSEKNKPESQQNRSGQNGPLAGPLGGPLNGPLGGAKTKSVGQSQIDNAELRNEIKKDVERTYQEFELFTNKQIILILTNVLFIWSKENSEISYRQGMNEVVASLIYVYFRETLYKEQVDKYEEATEEDKQLLLQFNSWEFAEADIYSVVSMLMNDAQHMEMFRPNYTEQQKIKLQSKKASAILTRVAKLQDILLKKVDLDLFRHLKLLQVEFQIFLLKWIRCMFTRELHLMESFSIWDAIFHDFYKTSSENLFFVDCIALAMILYIKPQVMQNEDSSQCYQKFLKFPKITDLPSLVDCANKISVLLTNSNSMNNLDENAESQSNVKIITEAHNIITFKQVETIQQVVQDKNLKQLAEPEKIDQGEQQHLDQKQQIVSSSSDKNIYFDHRASSQNVSKTIRAQLSVDQPRSEQQAESLMLKKESSINIPLKTAQEFYETIQKAFNFIKQSEESQNHQELIISLAELKQYLNSEIQHVQSHPEIKDNIVKTDGGFVIKKTINDDSKWQETGLKSKMVNIFKKKW